MIMRILRHADQAVTMEIYANASSAARVRRCGDLETSSTDVLLYLQLEGSATESECVSDQAFCWSG